MAYTVIYQVFRKAGMSHAEFAEYWVSTHSPIAAKLPGARSYTNYVVDAATDAADPVPDGFTVLSFDSEADFTAAMESPEMAASGEDAAKFTSHFAVFSVDPHQIV
ncbi:MAG TPA: EthD family reductase [Solirubrobacteraceae bacterium]|jgi:uncharacterized protein (TIGR02118 family)|nr:EthD family reductase [Solirubrobacteraceae bacterium]